MQRSRQPLAQKPTSVPTRKPSPRATSGKPLDLGTFKKLQGTVKSYGSGFFMLDVAGVTMKCTYDARFFPIDIGDAVSCTVRPDIGGNQVVKPPLVIIGKDTNTIVKFLCKTLNCREEKGSSWYRELNAHGSVCSVLDRLVEDRSFSLNSTLLPKQISSLRTQWEKRMLRQLYLFDLNKREIRSTDLPLSQIFKYIIDNCYLLLSFPMEKCVKIFDLLGKVPTEEQTQCALIARTLYGNTYSRGWTGTPSSFLQRDFKDCHLYMPMLVEDYKIKTGMSTIYLPKPFEIECGLAKVLQEIKGYPLVNEPVVTRGLIQLGDDQMKALEMCLSCPLSIITGGAGTGKTTMIAEIVHNLEIRGKSYLLCSFTGKAVSRLKEAVGRPSATINRYLTQTKKIGDTDQLDILGIPRNPDYVIVDESSMVTMELFHSLLMCSKKVSYPRIILVGDVNQLPPISWGSLLQELLLSEIVPLTYLLKNRRVYEVEDEVDGILLNASHIINCACEEEAVIEETANFMVIEDVINVEELISGFHQGGIKISIIAPYNKDLPPLNRICQKYYSDLSKGITDGLGVTWYVGDRVMMTVNNYDINIMNGEEGYISGVSEEGVTVDIVRNMFEGVTKGQFFTLAEKPSDKRYYQEDDDSLEKDTSTKVLAHSFANTIHKYQGSEYDFVLLYLDTSNQGNFLNRHLLYTAVTRARRALYLVGDVGTYTAAMLRGLPWRCCKLNKRMKEANGIVKEAEAREENRTREIEENEAREIEENGARE